MPSMDSPGSARYRRKLSLESPMRRLSPQPPPLAAATTNSSAAASSVASWSGLRTGAAKHRKMSFPSATNGSHLPPYSGGGLSVTSLDIADAARRYRRFSNVSDAVSRKLSTTIGWRTVSIQEVVTQAKSMCGQHIRSWLKRRGLFTRRLGLQRLRSVANLPGGLAVCDVFVQLEMLSMEMERRHPKLYSGVCRQMGLTVASEKTIAKYLSSMALEMFKVDITWFKIASFYNLVSGAAVDCVRQGHPEYLYGLVEMAGLVIERDAGNWIANQGGWVAILSKYKAPEDTSVFQMIALSVVGLIVLLVSMMILLRTMWNMIFSFT